MTPRNAPHEDRSVSIVARLRSTFLLMLLGCVGVVVWSMYSSYSALLESRLRLTRNEVARAHEIAQTLHAKVGPGLTDEQARAQAVEQIMKIRYDGKEYVWVNDMQPRMVAHPFKPELNGKDLTDFKDPAGTRLFVEMAARVKASGEGYVDYLWPKPERPDPEPKRSYVKGFAPWGWVIGSGVYVDDVVSIATQEAVAALAVMLGVAVLGMVTVEWVARGMRSRLRQAGSVMEGIANGDLTREVPHGARDEVGVLLHQVATTQQRLATLVQQIHQSADSIGTASREIASGNQDLSTRTEQTAFNLQQAAGSMGQLTATVRQSADAAAEANRMAMAAADVAERGGKVVSEVVSTMNEINESARKISDIITVIDGLAFQTNILALNAAVEAARAGEQGRGFAVVAGEVRSLAHRSAEAAKQIKHLIGSSVERVDSGTQLVADAGSTIAEVVSAAKQVAQIIGEVTVSAAEQSDGLATVNRSVGELDQMTQQNAALVEQAAAAADSLRAQAQDLVTAVGSFRLGHAASQESAVKAPAYASRPSSTPRPTVQPARSASQTHGASAAPPVRAAGSTPRSVQTAEPEWEAF